MGRRMVTEVWAMRKTAMLYLYSRVFGAKFELKGSVVPAPP